MFSEVCARWFPFRLILLRNRFRRLIRIKKNRSFIQKQDKLLCRTFLSIIITTVNTKSPVKILNPKCKQHFYGPNKKEKVITKK